MARQLLFTIVLDPPRCSLIRAQGKLFALSVLRSGFEGDFIIFSNAKVPLFPHGRRGITEIRVPTGRMKGMELAEYACALKFRARDFIERPEQYDRILFTDCDCLALNSLEPLFAYEEEVVWAGEPGRTVLSQWHRGYFTPEELALEPPLAGINAGTFSVKGNRYREVSGAMIELMKAGPVEALVPTDNGGLTPVLWGDQPGWNKLAHLGGFSNTGFRPGEVMFPLLHHPDYREHRLAPLVHFCGAGIEMKMRMQFGLYAGHYLSEAAPLIMDLTEN
jgi:hypothetical protein